MSDEYSNVQDDGNKKAVKLVVHLTSGEPIEVSDSSISGSFDQYHLFLESIIGTLHPPLEGQEDRSPYPEMLILYLHHKTIVIPGRNILYVEIVLDDDYDDSEAADW